MRIAHFAILYLSTFAVYSEEIQDLTELPIESVLNMDVYSASKFIQKKSDAPTAVTVITAQDIKDYGYRTVADIIQSVRGIYVTSDRNYSYAGTRGLSIPGDANTRVLVLLDGYRLNDATYDQGPLGTEFPVDVDLIERVEYLPGAGSAIYGNNAFFGVINVITKSGKDYKGHGVEVSGRFASFGTDQERASFGRHFDNGLEMLISATRYDSEGENNLHFPDINSTTTHPAFDSAGRLFGKFSWQHFTLETGYSRRKKGLPIGYFNTVFNDPRNQNIDQHLFVNLTYDNQIAEHLGFYARAYHGRYDYPGNWANALDDGSIIVQKELGLGRWWGSEVRLTSTHLAGHKLMLGGEFQDNYRLSDQFVQIERQNAAIIGFQPTTTPGVEAGFMQATNRYGIYFQDEIMLTGSVTLNAGLRYDHLNYAGDAINPRLALIVKPWNKMTFKLLYGSSFRAPTANELYYMDPGYIPNTMLKPEKIKTYESILEYQYDRSLRLTAVGFHYQIDNLITLATTPDDKNQYVNAGMNKAWGAEFETEKLWEYGTRLRASYTWVNAYDISTNLQLPNSPSNLFKLNLSTPLLAHSFRAGVEAQYTSSRLARDNITRAAGYPMFNLSLTSDEKLFTGSLKGLEISASIYNLLDRKYASIASDDFIQQFIPQNGRNFRVVFSYRY